MKLDIKNIKESTIEKISILIIMSWLPGALGFAIMLALSPAMSNSPSPILTLLFGLASLMFMVESGFMLILHLYILTVLVSATCIYLSARMISLQNWSQKTLILSIIALLGHAYLIYVLKVPAH